VPGDAPRVRPLPYFFTPDATGLVYLDQATAPPALRMLSVDGSGTPEWSLTGTSAGLNAELSPDGRWMAYQSSESGEWQIYVRPFPNVTDDKVLVSNGGGTMPVWSRDGRSLFYVQPAPAKMMAVSIDLAGLH